MVVDRGRWVQQPQRGRAIASSAPTLRLTLHMMLALVLLCAALVSLTPALGKRESHSISEAGLGFAACPLPCWAGLIPGHTRFSQTVTALENHLPQLYERVGISSSQVHFRAAAPDQEFWGQVHYSKGLVGHVQLHLSVPIWYLLEKLGTPGCVWVSALQQSQRTSLAVYWERDGISTGAMLMLEADTLWQPTTRMEQLWMSVTDSACDRDDSLPWQGFAPLWRYEAAARRR